MEEQIMAYLAHAREHSRSSPYGVKGMLTSFFRSQGTMVITCYNLFGDLMIDFSSL